MFILRPLAGPPLSVEKTIIELSYKPLPLSASTSWNRDFYFTHFYFYLETCNKSPTLLPKASLKASFKVIKAPKTYTQSNKEKYEHLKQIQKHDSINKTSVVCVPVLLSDQGLKPLLQRFFCFHL